MTTFQRLPFVFLALLCLLVGLWSGLNRMGWNFGALPVNIHHGAIMVGGFLGTLISLEKIIPLRKKILFVIPLLSACSIPFFFAGLAEVSFLLLVVASGGLSLIFFHYLSREKNLIYLLGTTGSLCWLMGNILLFTRNFYPLAFPWWLGFALFIITSERLELMKFLPVTRARKAILGVLLTAYLCGVILSFHGAGGLLCGVSLAAIAIWLMRYDIAGISLKRTGMPKFVAVALLCGYTALLLTGVFILGLDNQPMAYDVVVHTFFLGFVFSMIFAHGPIIIPGVLGISAKPYHPVLYAWLVLLHLSWAMRVAADILLDFQWRRLSGIITAVAIPAYFITIAYFTIVNHRRHAKIL